MAPLRPLLALLCLLPVACGGGEEDPGAGGPAASDPPAPPTGPNVLLIHSDQHRGDSLSLSGHPFSRTPALDRLAAEGAWLSDNYVQAPQCRPSRASFHTGTYVDVHGCATNRHEADPDLTTWGALLADAGWNVGRVGRHHGFGPPVTGPPIPVGDSFPQIDSTYWPKNPGVSAWGTSPVAVDDYFDVRITDAAIERIRELASEEGPWLMSVGLFAPHPPFYPPTPYDALLSPDEVGLPAFDEASLDTRPSHQRASHESKTDRLTEADQREVRARYYGLLALMDDQVTRLLDELDALGLADDTLVVYTSDHGDVLGEHGLFGKNDSFYDGEVRVPSMLRLPGRIPTGSVVDSPTEQIDLGATVLALCGVAPDPKMRGRDLGPAIRGEVDAVRDFATSTIDFSNSRARGLMLTTERWKLCWYTGEAGELYDRAADPAELANLYEDPDHAITRDRLLARLAGHLLSLWGDLEGPDREAVFHEGPRVEVVEPEGQPRRARLRFLGNLLVVDEHGDARMTKVGRDPETAQDRFPRTAFADDREVLMDLMVAQLSTLRYRPTLR